MINTEKELEDYICEHQEEFIEQLKDTLFLKKEDIKFLGRQVQIGHQNIADLIYYYDTKNDYEIFEEEMSRNYIIVELKNRILESKDLGQLGRYMTTLYDKLSYDGLLTGFEEIKGVLVGYDLDRNMQEIQMLLEQFQNNIYFINIKTKIEFDNISYCHNLKYLDELVLDSRIKEYYEDKSNE